MNKFQSLQDPYLNTMRKERIPVAVYLVNGIKLHGHIESFDAFVLVLRNNNISQMVYKHAISTIVPTRSIRLHHGQAEGDEIAISSEDSPRFNQDPLY